MPLRQVLRLLSVDGARHLSVAKVNRMLSIYEFNGEETCVSLKHFC